MIKGFPLGQRGVGRWRQGLCMLMLGLGLGLSPVPAAPAAAASLPDPPQDAYAVYVESRIPTVEYEATVSVDLPLGSGSFEVVRQGGVTYARPKPGTRPGQVRRVSAGFEPEIEQIFAQDLLRQNYVITIRNGPVLLGRETWEIVITPRWPGSPSRRVVVDRASRVRMVVEDRDHAGRVLQHREIVRFHLTRGRWAAQIPTAAKGDGSRPWLSLEQAAHIAGFRLALPRHLPPGYRLFGVRVLARPQGLVQFAFFDGLGVISLYERAVPWWARRGARERLEPGGYAWARDGMSYYLVGDIPPQELREIAASIR